MCVHIFCYLLSVRILFSSLQTVASLKSRVDSAPIPAAKKADIRAKIAILQVLQWAKHVAGLLQFFPTMSDFCVIVHCSIILLMSMVLLYVLNCSVIIESIEKGTKKDCRRKYTESSQGHNRDS